MIRHLFVLVWNRKRTNALLAAELFVSFLVLFGVVTTAVYTARKWSLPVGVVYRDVIDVEIDTQGERRKLTPADSELFRQVAAAARALPEVEGVAAGNPAPFTQSSWRTDFRLENGRQVRYAAGAVTDEWADVLSLQVTRGRFFSREDDAAKGFRPMVITEQLAHEVFGDADPIGKELGERAPDGSEEEPYKVVGVLAAYRQNGELDEPIGYGLQRLRWDGERSTDHMLVRVRPGTTAAFEERLVKTLQNVAKDWAFRAQPLSASREVTNRLYVVPLILLGGIAGFFALMVALGLIGVLWQNVTQRTREIGLRRAKGAAAANVRRQVIGEIAAVTTFAVGLGSVFALQLPILAPFDFVSGGTYLVGYAISVVLVYALAFVCALYPAHLATRVAPAEALRYE